MKKQSFPVRPIFLGMFVFFFLVCIFLPNYLFAAEQSAEQSVLLDGVAPDQVDSVLAKLSDEQVRGLLISELTKDLEAAQTVEAGPSGGLVSKATGLLHLLDSKQTDTKETGVFIALGKMPVQISDVMRKIGNGSLRSFAVTVLLLVLLFGVSFLVEYFLTRFTADFSKQFKDKVIPDLDGPMRFIAGFMRSIPDFMNIFIFSTAAILLFFFVPAHDHPPVRYLFLAVLSIIVFYRICRQFTGMLCSPQIAELRILPVNDTIATSIDKGMILFCSYTFSVVMLLALFMELQLGRASFAVLVVVFSTTLIAIIVKGILNSREFVKSRILAVSDANRTRNWIVEQFAQFWHVPTLFYFGVVWLILLNDQLSGVQRQNAAFLLSLLIIPLFVLFDGIGQWVVKASVNGLKIYDPRDEETEDEEIKAQLAEAQNRQRKITVTAGRFVRLAVLCALLIWSFRLWGYELPFAAAVSRAVFQSLITLGLGLAAWRIISSYIEKKIAEVTPEEEENEDSGDEFGGAAQRGRSFTLLPLLRKVVASTLLVMVSLIIISSLGVDIGPLLAGAGVVGLAVGFGAQKMVSDIFSGFFFLLDDAFRVGEYIQAGSVSGTVESITLRNVMLRHHRGMLQIVPHSDLGSITNFMRGGIIVKFNLEFPYDANVEKIRKVIKKVGKAMLEDEEFGKDFIQPVKSGGVREIKGSVMTIRVKFKAQPGTHFVIRREAYRRITDALAAQGINYAHRKVIVELPEEQKKSISEDQQKAILQAGAAAQIQLEQEEKNTQP